jgi:nucleotide-binding universal stress UspA family protein
VTRYLVAVPAGESGSDVLALAAAAQEGIAAELDVVTVVPAPWEFRSKASVDAEFVAFTEQRAAETLARARERLGPDRPGVGYTVLHERRSVATTLLDRADETAADAVLLGSSRGPKGRLSLGSTTNSLLHRSPVPLVLAPEGYDPPAGTRVSRVTVGVSGASGQQAAVDLAVKIAADHDVPLRIATVQVMDADMAIPVVGFDTERVVDDEWTEELRALHRTVLAGLPSGLTAGSVITRGTTWAEALDALDPLPGELLVIGSSGQRLLRQVFLGTHGSKIIRNAGVPVVVVPAEGED